MSMTCICLNTLVDFPLLVLKGIDFTTGYIFSFCLGDLYRVLYNSGNFSPAGLGLLSSSPGKQARKPASKQAM